MVGSKNFLNNPTFFDKVLVIVLSLITFSMLYPLLNLVFISFSDIKDVITNKGIFLIPNSFNLEAYSYVFRYGGLGSAFNATLFITIVGTLINLAMTSAGAYVLSNRDLPGRNFLMTLVLITMFFNGGLIPTYLVVQSIQLTNTLWALILPTSINTFYLILARNFFQQIPISLKESAKIDGASEFRIMISIILPLSLPILSTLGLFYGVAHWNEYSQAIIYLYNRELYPLQVIIREMYEVNIMQLDSETLAPPVETIRCATVILATLPIICIYPFLQKYFVKGVMVGAVKG